MSHRPAILERYKLFQETIMGAGTLERRLKTLAYLTAAYANESPYDVAVSHRQALDVGLSEDEIKAVRLEQDHGFNLMEHAAIRISRELTRTCTLDDIDSKDTNLFTAEQLVELVAVVGLANFDNRFSNALDVKQEHAATQAGVNPTVY